MKASTQKRARRRVMISERARDPGVETPLHCAAEKNHVSCVDALIKAGAIVDSKVPGDWSALHMAVDEVWRPAALEFRPCQESLGTNK